MSLSSFDRARATRELSALVLARAGKALADERAEGIITLLDDVPLADLLRGLNLSARRDSYFPDAARIRRAAKAADAAARSAPLPPTVAAAIANGEVHCTRCEDTGWWPETRTRRPEDGPMLTALALEQMPAERREALLAQWGSADRVPVYPRGEVQTRVRPCPCRPTNPIYGAKRASEARNPRHERDE